MKYSLISSLAALLLATSPLASAAAEKVQFTMVAEQEIVKVDADGRRRVVTVPATSVTPGQEVIYTIFVKNVTPGPIGEIVVVDPIPEDMRYIGGSAFGAGTNISYSIDGGQQFGTREQLRVAEADGRRRLARPGEYTHIKWKFNTILQSQDRGFVSFRALLR